MRLFIGDRILNMTSKELDSLYLNEGSEGVIYRNGHEVYKIYKDTPLVCKVTPREVGLLRNLKLKRFVVPNEIIYDENSKLIGYTSNYIEGNKFDKLYEMRGKDFKKEIYRLLDDINILSSNNLEIDDLHLDNILFSNNSIYFIDAGGIKYKDDDKSEIEKTNKFRFEYFIVNYLLSRTLAKKNRKKLEREFEACGDIRTFLESMDDEENVKNFAKRIIR